MDARGTLHERHHGTLQANVLIIESGPGPEVRMPPPPDAFDPCADDDDPVASLLAFNVANSSTVDQQARGREDDRQGLDGHSRRNSPSPERIRSWDETYRFRKRFGGLPALDTLDVMREASRICRKQFDLMISLTAVFIVPVSVVVLTHVLATRPVIHWLERTLEVDVFEESIAAAVDTSYTKFVYLKVAEFLVTSVLCIPLGITLTALAKAGVVYTVASTYAGVKVSFVDILYRVVPRVWLPLVITYGSSGVIVLGVAVVLLLLFTVINNAVFTTFLTSSVVMLFFFATLGLALCGILVYLKIILNVANVICILEDKRGFAALTRSFSILQQGRVQAALGCFVITFLCGGLFTLLFEYRVTDKNAYTESNNSGSWEGPLLVLMHSVVYLFDDITTTVIYFTCPSSSSFEAFDASRLPESSIALSAL